MSTYDRPLYSTWQLSFDHIERQSKLSAQLLKLWAYFDNQDLWFELVRERRPYGPEWLSQLTEDELSFNEAVRILCDHGLVEVDKASKANGAESQGYGMHSCVHSWTLYVLNQEWDTEMAETAIDCVAMHIPESDSHKSWVIKQRLTRHAAKCWSFIDEGVVDEGGREWILFNLGNLYSYLGKHDDAKKMYGRALEGSEKTLGPDHTSTLHTVNNLGGLYYNLEELDKAEIMYQRALQGYEKALGPDHTCTLSTVHNLGVLYTDLGELDKAKIMYQRALEGKEKTLGPDHTSTLHTVNNLGGLYCNLEELDKAEIMNQRALQGYEKALGPKAVKTYVPALDTTWNLGLLYEKLGRFSEARNVYSCALHGYQTVFGRSGKDYQRVAAALEKLGINSGD